MALTAEPAVLHTTLGKLVPPRLGRVFGRERLFALLDAQASQPATWVWGPPGAGKTTLVATYNERVAGSTTLWLQLDAQDADAATFAHFLGLALAAASPRGRRLLPQPSADDLRDTPAYLLRLLSALSVALSTPAPGRWTLVLDNVQELPSASPLHAGLAAALPQLPPGARVLCISRDPPPPAYARALATQQLALIDAAALPFNLDEARTLAQLHGAVVCAEALHHSSAGWAAAMILMLAGGNAGVEGACLRVAPADTTDALGASAIDAATRARLFDFFAAEVLATMPADEAEALCCIAFLPSATPAMAAALSGQATAGALLARLAARSLFTDRRAGAEPVYTFHALFGAFLRSQAAATRPAAALQALQRAAAGVLAAQGQVDVAITQLLQAAAWDDAVSLLLRHVGGFVAQGRTPTVLAWIAALPAQHLPPLLYWRGFCRIGLEPQAALDDFLLAAAAEPGSVADALPIAAAAADTIVSLGACFEGLERWLPALTEHAPAYLAQRALQPDVERDLRIVPGLLAAYVHRRTADPLTARLADVAEALLDQPQARSQRILLGSFAMYLLWTGQLSRLDRTMAQIDRLCSAAQDSAALTRLRWYGTGVLIRSLRGQVDAALADAQAALDLVGEQPALQARAHLLMVLASLTARDAPRARRHLAEATARVAPSDPINVTTYEFQCALLAMLDGDWAEADRLMRASLASAPASGWPLRVNIAQLGAAMAATQVGDFERAERTLVAARAEPFFAVCRFHHWIGALVAADLADRRGDTPGSLAALREAFAVAREHGYDHGPLPFCCGDTLSRLCALALQHGIDRAFALRLISRHALPVPASALHGAAAVHWPWPLRVVCLGRFAIDVHGAGAPASRKESRKPLDLLKLMVALGAYGGRGVRAERLATLLWPQMEGDAAQNSLDNAVHRLRKLVGERQVLLQAGALSLNPATVWVDVAALEAALEAVPGVEPQATATMLAMVDEAMSLYQGDFLAGDDAHPDILQARGRLQALFLRRLTACAAALQAQGRSEVAAEVCRRIVERDPLAEAVVRQWMRCLIQLGRRAEAYAAYRACRQQLSVLLQIRPAAETETLVASLCQPHDTPDRESLSDL